MSDLTPNNGENNPQPVPWYKKKPVIITAGVLTFLVVVNVVSGPRDSSSTPEPSNTSDSMVTPDPIPQEPEVTQEPEPEPVVTEEPEPEGPVETLSQSNARSTAGDYIDSSGFSRSGLIDQLKFEGYSTADSTYAVDAIEVNWNEQAARTAQAYLDSSSFSSSGLYDQLVFEGYTSSQANYGLSAVGY